MKAFQEIGFRRVLHFGTYTIAMAFMKWLLFPQLPPPYLSAKIEAGTIHDIRFFNHYQGGFSALNDLRKESIKYQPDLVLDSRSAAKPFTSGGSKSPHPALWPGMKN